VSIVIEPVVEAEPAYEIARAAETHDHPSQPFAPLESFRATLAVGWPGYSYERYLGLLDGVPVGYLALALAELDNLDSVNVGLHVLPSARRHGVGRALYALAVERTRALGRHHLIGTTMQRHPDGSAFAAAVGATAGLEEIESRLDLRTVDQPRLDAMLAEAWKHADGYQLVQWRGVPPDEIIDDVAYLDSRLNADAPIGDIAFEPTRVDAERIRLGELNRAARGRASYHSGALHDGRLVAWTGISGLIAEPRQAGQDITLVAPEHRGHRLGTVVKLANLAYVRAERPGLEAIDTWNAATNEHMLRINRAMGFEAVDSAVYWQQTLSAG
jgi:GNAT superfamily N-acetyltransferase